jgi:elongation factor 2
MPKFRQMAEIVKLMERKESIRNIGVIAHIDHGKTTMTDSLLVEAGLLPVEVAGSARALDYLKEEQRRGITIKTANISFLHQTDGQTYLINLVDTPGHVDFTGKVARALRTIDAAIVVVDAVEEVMAQTQTVIRQALEERVKPLLFINKVDRLIKELRFSPTQIQTKLLRIINDFNLLVELYAEPQFMQEWKVDAAKGSVVFGSALDKWGLTLEIAEKKGIKFNDAEFTQTYDKGDLRNLVRTVPLHSAVLDMIVKHAPNPVQSQKYRVQKIWKGKLDSEIGQAMVTCDEKGPTVMCVTSVQNVPKEGLVVAGRIFSGSIMEGDQVYLVNSTDSAKVGTISIYMSSYLENVDRVSAGNIAAMTGLESARAGETVVDFKYRKSMVPFESVTYVSDPVMSIAIEPTSTKDLPRILETLDELTKEDPNLKFSVDEETGEYLLSGMGELHLEVAQNLLKERLGNVNLRASTPTAAFRETITTEGALVLASSSNKLNRFSVRVETLGKKAIGIVEKSLHRNQPELYKHARTLLGQGVVSVEENANVLTSSTRMENVPEDLRTNIVRGFRWACRTGPLCERPTRGMQVKLLDLQFDQNPDSRDPSQIMRTMSRAISGSFLTARPTLMEAIYRIEVSVPLKFFGACSNIMVRRRAKIEFTEKKDMLAIMRGSIPVTETFGLAAEMRSATSGGAFWQLAFDRWQIMPEKLVHEIVKHLREERGLPGDLPKPEVFVDEIRK